MRVFGEVIWEGKFFWGFLMGGGGGYGVGTLFLGVRVVLSFVGGHFFGVRVMMGSFFVQLLFRCCVIISMTFSWAFCSVALILVHRYKPWNHIIMNTTREN